MPIRETEQEDFTKPSRQSRGSGGKKQKNRNEVRVPKEPYRRQRISKRDAESVFDEDNDDSLYARDPNSFPLSSREDPNGED